jgi:shikimate kinase
MIFDLDLPERDPVASAHRILLVGFMGSGKSVVAPRLAESLGWRAIDVDERIEELEGATVPDIFGRRGESYFRAVEAGVVAELLRLDRVVLATGGGWGAQPGRLAALPSGSVSIWLQVSAEEAIRRIEGEPGRRPLLDTDDPLAEARRLLAIRSPEYAEADAEVDTDGRSPDAVAREIREILAGRPWNLTNEKA